MSQRRRHHKDVEDLMAVSHDIERAGPPSLRDPRHVEDGAGAVQEPHHDLVAQGAEDQGVVPVEGHGVGGRDDAGAPHAEEQPRPEGTEAAAGEGGGEQGDDDEDPDEGDGGEVEEAPVGVVGEGVVDGGEEGADDHEGDPDVVEAPEEEVEPPRVAGEEVGDGAEDEARHRPAQEHEPRPRRDGVRESVQAEDRRFRNVPEI